jgi:hypothetical protein
MWIYPIQFVLAAFLAYEISFMQGIRPPGGWIALVIFMAAFLLIDSYFRKRDASAFKRLGISIGLALIIIVGNSASTLTRCDKQHHCHRVI